MTELLAAPEAHKQLEAHTEHTEDPQAIEHPIENTETNTDTIIESLRSIAETQAVSGKETIIGEKGQPHESDDSHASLHQQLRQTSFERSLQKIRSHMSGPDRQFSRFVHQPAIDAVSNFSAKTIARPSGLLIGSLFALIGSVFTLYMARRYGFLYNNLLFMFLFAAGYIVGLFCELSWRLLHRR